MPFLVACFDSLLQFSSACFLLVLLYQFKWFVFSIFFLHFFNTSPCSWFGNVLLWKVLAFIINDWLLLTTTNSKSIKSIGEWNQVLKVFRSIPFVCLSSHIYMCWCWCFSPKVLGSFSVTPSITRGKNFKAPSNIVIDALTGRIGQELFYLLQPHHHLYLKRHLSLPFNYCHYLYFYCSFRKNSN